MRRIQGYNFKHKGYSYHPMEDREPDVIKMYHVVESPDGTKACHMPLSPYRMTTKESFEAWIDSGMPSRDQINEVLGTRGNPTNEEIIRYYVEKILLG